MLVSNWNIDKIKCKTLCSYAPNIRQRMRLENIEVQNALRFNGGNHFEFYIFLI